MNVALALVLVAAVATTVLASFDPMNLLCLVNQARVRYGLNTLGYDTRLQRAAEAQCSYQAAESLLTHTGSGGTSPGARITSAGYKWSACSENVAYGYNSEAQAFKYWMQSTEHRANILSRTATHMGAAMAETSSGQPYYTQDFASDGQTHNFAVCPGGDDDDDDSSGDSYSGGGGRGGRAGGGGLGGVGKIIYYYD